MNAGQLLPPRPVLQPGRGCLEIRPSVSAPAPEMFPLQRRPECAVFAAVLLLSYWPVWTGASPDALIFRPAAVAAGEWWRLLTHAFVHVTWYHLLLDASAFLILLRSLIEPKMFRRLAYVAAGAIGSALFSWWGDPTISVTGLCGLSGVAHGLAAISACEWLTRSSAERRLGIIALILVVGKAALEVLSGQMLFSSMHFGLLGIPVATAHAGGIIGALLVRLWFGKRD